MTTHRRFSPAGALVLLLALVSLGYATPSVAQQPPTNGVVGAALRLRQIDGVKRVLMIGAHPDDEDSSLLAAMARGMGIETAYLALTRGDGGQNLIGPELSEGLGVIRTGELVAARSIDGAQQYFTRALDYGFSKSADEAFAHWPKEVVLGDVVWVIRKFRPQVIVSVFSGTPADGHGHHQAAGILAVEAFAAAGDATRFPEQLAYVLPWQPTKLFRTARRDPAGTPTTVVQTGVFDPLFGRSWSQVALEGRSQHRSQGQGRAQPPGSFVSQLVLLQSKQAVAPGASLFAGVDTTLTGLAAALGADAPAALEHLRAYRDAIHQAEASLGVTDPALAVPHLARALRELSAVAVAAGQDGPRGGELARTISHHTLLARAALLSAAGVVIDASVADGQLVPGAQTTVTIRAWNGGRLAWSRARPELVIPASWSATLVTADASQAARPPQGPGAALVQGRNASEVAESGTIDPGEVAAWSFRVRVPADARPNDPYFLREPLAGDLFRWPNDSNLWGLPFDPPLIQGGVSLQADLGDGQPATIRSIGEAAFVGVTPSIGEYREPVLLTPALSVALDQPAMGWPIADREPREIAVRLQSATADGVRGNVRLEAPAGWSVEPVSIPFSVERRGSTMSVVFRVRPPGNDASGKVTLRAVAEGAAGGRWDQSIITIDYPHLRRAAYLMPAELAVARVPVQVAQGRRVGYVMGTGDGGLEALKQLGADVVELTPQRVQAGDFSGLDVIVVGVRAYEVRPDLIAANARVLDFARAGGTLIVQYQQSQNPSGGFTPYPLTINSSDRVTDEKAPVTILDPTAPVFTSPNRIEPADFDGWAQERGTYFAETWDDRYTPLIEMHDPGEETQRGSLLVAPLDKGLYVYSTVAFFRQFPEAVPGAYRLFANLVSLDPQAWARHAAEGVR